uniref:Uncharacterized protein n=1 Tax=Tanacetum cinerariifolium TaxID=118510 RepID=A0A6L2NWV0_TANCI|nr:hypothetical protein [Tanacetum cinerariifolium]
MYKIAVKLSFPHSFHLHLTLSHTCGTSVCKLSKPCPVWLPVHWDKIVIVVINEVRVSEYEKWMTTISWSETY